MYIKRYDQDRKMLLNNIMKYQFATLETALYLDTHPNDLRALNQHNQYSHKLMELKREYELKYEPLTHYGKSQEYWKYINSPWPWEVRY